MSIGPRIRNEKLRWDNAGPDNNPKARLFSSFQIDDYPMNIEAIEVKHVDGQQWAVDASFEEDLNDYHSAAQADGSFDTTEINGRTYVLFAYPSTK